MNLNEYQTQAMSFRLPSADESYAFVNLGSEVGELYGHYAKHIRDGGDEAKTEALMLKELGDILWCVTAIASDLGSSLDEIASGNIHKLSARKDKGTIQGSGDVR